MTRTAIALVTRVLSRRVRNPTNTHQAGEKRVLRYLKETLRAASRIMPSDGNQLYARVDASRRNEPGIGRKIRSGSIIDYAGVSIYTITIP